MSDTPAPLPPGHSATPGPTPPGATPPPPSRPPAGFAPRPAQPTMHPRKVRGGVRLELREGTPLAWAGQRWMRLVEDHAPNAALTEGIQYARLGQTRSLQVMPGHVSARVQGRLPSAYVVDIRLPVITHEQWEQATAAMLDEARHLAGLLSGEVPAGIEDLFAPLHLRLFPNEPSDVAISCTCGRRTGPMYAMPDARATGQPPAAPLPAQTAPFAHDQSSASAPTPTPTPAAPLTPTPTEPATPFCKHVCCVMAILAERFSRDPFMIFALRGMTREDLLESLRQKRALAAARSGKSADGSPVIAGSDRPVPAYSPRIPGVGEEIAPALELCLSDFWRTGPQLQEVDLALVRPATSHLLLRRLGTSPFPDGKFPLVGLLATCYDVISDYALRDNEPAVGNDPAIAPGETG